MQSLHAICLPNAMAQYSRSRICVCVCYDWILWQKKCNAVDSIVSEMVYKRNSAHFFFD